MSSNPFKSQYKKSAEDTSRYSNQSRGNNVRDSSNNAHLQNRFREKNAKPTFSLNDQEFPAMSAPQSATETLNSITGLDYKAATFVKDVETEEKTATEDYVPPGYTLIYMDENRNIVQKHGENTQNNYCIFKEDKEMEPSQVLQQLANSWELRKQQYDELHGEGEYDRLYGIPCEENESEYSEDEYDDVNDYYDY